jgi:hypothetical protein
LACIFSLKYFLVVGGKVAEATAAATKQVLAELVWRRLPHLCSEADQQFRGAIGFLCLVLTPDNRIDVVATS